MDLSFRFDVSSYMLFIMMLLLLEVISALDILSQNKTFSLFFEMLERHREAGAVETLLKVVEKCCLEVYGMVFNGNDGFGICSNAM